MERGINPRLLKAEPMQRCCLTDCRAACCLYGVWIDRSQAQELIENAHLIAPYMPDGFEDPQLWFDGRQEADDQLPSGQALHSRVLVDPSHYGRSACVFLRGDHKCALQVAGRAACLQEWHFKPFYCVLHPLDLDDQGNITLDETETMLAEEGSCLRAAPQPISLLDTFEPELLYLLGDAEFQRLKEAAGQRGYS